MKEIKDVEYEEKKYRKKDSDGKFVTILITVIVCFLVFLVYRRYAM